MQETRRGFFSSHLRPQSHALALEPRILFDGAAASAAVDQHQSDPVGTTPAPVEAVSPHAIAKDGHPAAEQAPSAARTLLVLDSRIENREQLVAQLPANVTAVVVNGGEDGLAAISAALAKLGQVDSIQVLSHGSAGQFTLGSRTLSTDNIGQLGQTLEQWRDHLGADADIQLYGCNVGAGAAGKTLVSELARLTGADVAASSNETGSTAAGGDWNLETRVGDIDKAIALSSTAIAGFDGLLADAAPTVTLPASGIDVLLGNTFTFTVDFANPSSQAGYAPFLNVFMPATGRDGNDGASFVSASFLGQALVTHIVVFDAAGNATHPIAKDSSGNFLVLNASTYGMNPGDQLVVLELPFASVTNSQPVISVQVTASLSNLADTAFSNGTPDLTIRASGGFEFGNDALDNPSNDPSIIEAGTLAFVVHPTVITFDQTLSTPEGETATGPNYGRTLTVTITPAPGQTLQHVVVTQPLPDNVQVTAISPGPGGRLTSITLHDGTVVSEPIAIAALIAAADDVYINSFTVEYDSLAAATSTVVAFYVPEVDANGLPIINPVTGDDVTITLGAPTAAGQWVPLDPRDVVAPNTVIDFSGSGLTTQFVAKSITLLKQVTLQTDIGQTGISPGDTLQYSLNLAISDYFAFGKDFFEQGQLVIRDQLSDGQTLSGTPTMTVTLNGVPQTITLLTTTVINDDGSTSLVFDIAQSLLNAFSGVRGWLNGDLAFDQTLQGAVLVMLSYSAVVGQTYKPPSGDPHSEINEGDELGNSATVDGTLLQDPLNLTGQSETDGSSTTSVIPTNTVNISLVEVNDGTPPSNAELRPGDEVTFELSYDLVTGDYEQFKLTAYLPLPLFNVNGITWGSGSDVGQWQLGAGNTNAGGVLSVTSGPGNSVVFDLGSFVTATTTGSRIVLRFTVRVGDQPFADQRSLDVLAQSSQQTTLTNQTLISSDIAVIVSVAEPVLNIKHGVVSGSNGTVSNTTGSWNPPGTSGAPFNGRITDLSAVDGNISAIDAADTLRLVTAIENSGGGAAFDVTTSITLPTGLSFVGGSLAAANLQIYRGDGRALVLGVDYSVSGNQITFLDNDNVATLLAGRSGTEADTSGANLVVISYDVVVSATIEASRTLQSTATLSNYASVNNGTDFTPNDLSDIAGQQVAAPVIAKVFADGSLDNGDSSASHTSGSDLVVGESMRYDIVITLPEGSTQNLRIDDLIPPGMRLDTSFNGGLGYQIITTRAGSAALGADFAGSVLVSGLAGQGGTLGNDGVDARWTFSVSSVAADNQTGNNTFVIRLQLVANNVLANQANKALQNNAQLLFSDPDSDTPNGTVAVDRTVALNSGRPTVTVREPTLAITQALTSTTGTSGYDEGDAIDFTITISNGNGSSDFNAFDISFLDNLPTQLDNVTLRGIQYLNGASNNGGVDFEIVNGQLRTANGANIDIVKGGSIVLRISAVVNASAAANAAFANLASVQWTSLDGPQAGERSGVDGPINGGTLNDYRNSSTLVIPVAQSIEISRVGGLPDTAAATPTNNLLETVTIGEIIRYRVVVLVPEGNNPNYQIQIVLANGLQFISPDALSNALRIAFISNGGLTSDANLIVGGTLNIDGNENSPEALPITADLSGAAPQGIFDPSRVTVVTNPDGSQVITFNLGNVVNGNGSDDDLEGISIEFNVRVGNQASNSATSGALAVTANEVVDGNSRAVSSTLLEQIVEPSFSGLDKSIIGFDPNPTGTTGSATVQLQFTQNGGLPAFDTQLSDSFANGSGYTLVSITIGGTTYGPANLPSGVSFSTSGGLSVNFDQLDVGTEVTVVYQVTLPNSATVASSNATLTWSSLPEDFTGWGGSAVGTDGTVEGERTGSTLGPNQYILHDSAGLGIISGTLWNDTASATASAVVDGPGLAGQTVTLTWAGLDGDLATSIDNLQFTTVTDSNGNYHFGVLPLGTFRIDAPSGLVSYPQPLGGLQVRIDSDSASPLGQINITLGDADAQTANAGYVEQNEAPVNSLPGTQQGLEDVPLAITGISVSDVDVDRDPDTASRNLSITLSVLHGTLSLGTSLPGVTVTGANSATLTLTGSLADLNSVLASLLYLGNQDFNGTDTLTVVSNDQGNYGDADGNGLPGQPTDALSDTDSLQILLEPVNDAPVAINDSAIAVEAGGTNNNIAGVNPRGNILANDSDVDTQTNGDLLHISSVGAVEIPTNGVAVIIGLYGRLLVGSNGSYEYIVDNNNPLVQALRLSSQQLVDTFDYVLSDVAGASDTATLTVTLRGANDTPVGVDDTGAAVEAGGVLNGTPGSNAQGNVLDNDTDVDTPANGESKTVTGIRALRESAAGDFEPIADPIQGTYGTLTIDANGNYLYVLDNTLAAVQRLGPNDQLVEFFSYRVTDTDGLHDVAQLRIVITGAHDNPLASDDQASAQAASSNGNSAESNPNGNVILFPSRPGTIDQAGGNGVDVDVDRADRPSSELLVNGVINKSEADYNPLIDTLTEVDAGTTSADGTVVTGLYGTLRIGADGTFYYDVDSNNAQVQALLPNQTLSEVFTYRIVDNSGLTDTAQLVITVHGVNDPPVAQSVVAVATEAGGVLNGNAGVNPSGDASSNDFDPDGDPLTVTLIHADDSPTPIPPTAVEAGGTTVVGKYGTLTIRPDGSYSYVLDNDNLDVQALRLSSDLLFERFTYTITDGVGPTPETDSAHIFILIRGQNDTPVAGDDTAAAVEAGGLANNLPGVDPTGNVFDNDSDVDGGEVPSDLPDHDYGETRAVSAVRTGIDPGDGSVVGTPGVLGNELRGTYGWLTLNADGSYSYRLDNAMAEVQALRAGNSLVDNFNYSLIDAAGAEDRANLTINIAGSNDTPTARNDVNTAFEAGGSNNSTPGVDPTGNVLDNDSDVDRFGESLSVVGVSQGASIGVIGSGLAGKFGTLTLNADGSYSYVLDNNNPTVQSLRTPSDTLIETFSYRIRDLAGATSTALLTITIRGADDNPVAVNDNAVSIEAGGTANGSAGINPTGNVLSNDRDVDANDTKRVFEIRAGEASSSGTFSIVAGTQTLDGLYGRLTINSDGTYSYALNNNLAAVQALKVGESLVETFSYRMRDTQTLVDLAQLSIRIDGAWDAPVAINNIALAVADNGLGNSINPTGNVLPNDRDVDAGDQLHVSGIRQGAETTGASLAPVDPGTNSTNGTVVNGLYGQLIIGIDGSYTYIVDSSNPAVLALQFLQTLEETFTYEVTDLGGLTDLAEIRILVIGRNDAPTANGDAGSAVEAGGLNNAQSGINPSGNVLANDTDLEGDALNVTTIRTGGLAESGTSGVVGGVLRGLYGDLTISADGSWSYVLDNNLAAVQALRTSGQTLTEVFTYSMSDIWDATDSNELRITVQGANDTPIAVDDNSSAVEAGGVANGTPGSDATGNVLGNDNDVDSQANGETRQVLSVSNAAGQSSGAGQVLVGLYGQLTVNADGSYRYVIDNSNPSVQALRTAGQTLSESFTYRMRDTTGATSDARLTVLIQGANDAPVARDDSATASDQLPAPQTSGNVLPNDSDVDGNDALHIGAVRSGAETGSGTAGTVGQPLQGLYGTLILNADGSYTYSIDLSNPQVLAAAGLGQVLKDVFTYTVNDLAGASDQAQLVITLEISAPFIPASGDDGFRNDFDDPGTVERDLRIPDPQPAVFITPVVERAARLSQVSSWRTGGSDLFLATNGEVSSESLGEGLGLVPGQFVAQSVRDSRLQSELDLAWILGRQGRTGLSADGLLSDPSLFTTDASHMTENPSHKEPQHPQRPANGFSAQLRAAAQRMPVQRDRQQPE